MDGFIKETRFELIPLTILLALTFLLFGQALWFGFVWDDILLVKDNPLYRNFDIPGMFLGLGNGVEYLPVRDFTYAVDFRLWGDNPAGFHLTNILFYALNVALAYLVTLKLVRFLRPGADRDLAFSVALIAAALFMVHPLHVEPVNFINNRNVLVAGVFFFLGLHAFLKYQEVGRRGSYWASLAFFILALFSKATVIVLPVLLGLLVVLRHGRKAKQYLPGLLPFFAIALAGFLLFRTVGHETNVIPSDQVISLAATGFSTRAAAAVQVPFFYIQKFFVPVGLSVEYDPGFSVSLFSPRALASGGLLVFLSLGAYLGRRRFPEGQFALYAFLVLLLPVMNFFLTNPVVADRYAYLPVYPLAVLVATVLTVALNPGFRIVLSTLICMTLSLLAFDRSGVWESDEILWRSTLEANPDSYLGIANLASNLARKGEVEKVSSLLNRLSSIRPSDISADAFAAKQAFRRGNYQAAIEKLENALVAKEPSPDAFYLLAASYERIGRMDKALVNYGKTINNSNVDAYGYKKLAKTRIEHLKPVVAGSFEPLRRSLQENPGNPQLIADLATGLDAAGLDDEALELYLELDRDYPPNWAVLANIGNIYLEVGNVDNAISYLRKSIAANQANPEAFNGLGLALKKAKDFKAAELAFLDAVRVGPEYRSAPFNLAILYFSMGRLDESQRYFEYTAEHFPELEERAEAYLSRLRPLR